MKRSNIGLILIFFLSVIPLIIWACLKGLDERFGGVIETFVSLGQISALLGLSLFSITLLLSTRLKIFDDYFGGMNKVYLYHHILGGISFILLLFHPLFLLARTLPVSLNYSAKFLLPEGYLAKDLGVYSLSLMILLLFLTFFVGLRYEIWKNSHRFLGIAFFLGGIHSMMVYSDIQNSTVLRYYMIFILSIGVVSYVYKTILGSLFVKKYSYRIIDKKILDNDIISIALRAEGKVMPYDSGQFVFVNFKNPRLPNEVHPFSISSENRGDTFTLTIKNLGDFTSSLKVLEIGDEAIIEGAFGKFNYKNSNNKKQIWIAGGIGVTPFLGMLEQLIKENDNSYEIDFYYCTKNKKEQDLILDILGDINKMKNIKFFSHCAVDHGWINAAYISSHSKDLMIADIFICGPLIMMRGLKEQFLKINIKSSKIISEEFKLN